MKKTLIIAAAALLLAGCGTEIEQNSNGPAVVTDAVTTSDETAQGAAETNAEAVTTSAPAEKTTEIETAATTAEKKKADPDDINVACMDTVEIYQQVKLKDFMFDSNAKLINGDDILDTEEQGEHEVTLKLDLDGAEGEKKVMYNVVDTTPPVMLLGDDVTIGTGTYFDPNDYISYADNCDRHPSMSWEGDVDTETEATYPITIYITDASGNTLTKSINVTVSDAPAADPYYDDSVIYFSDFVQQYDEPGREFGIDVSRWQGDIDFESVKDEGCSFAIIRMGYGEAGGADLDGCYYDNIEGAKKAGIGVGVYFYSTDTTKEGARATAKRIVEVLDGQKLDFPVAFDWEEFRDFQSYGMSIHDLSEIYEVFSEELEKNGYESMLYSSKNFLELFWENKKDRPVWVAHYVEQTTYTGKWYMWQRCGTGRISGIDGAVDLNVLQKE